VKASGATGGEALRSALESLRFTGTQTDYHYGTDDHTGQLRVVNPFAIGQWDGDKLTIVSPFQVSLSAKVGSTLVFKTAGRAVALRTVGGSPVLALRPGSYTIVARDTSPSLNLHLVGPGVNKKTTGKGTGKQTWKVKLGAGKLVYKSDSGGAQSTVTVG
jgi:hypothetical protein